MTDVIETEQLSKIFANDRGVRDINLSLHEGHIFGFLGPNGAGKSTFVKMMVGLLHPSSGQASVLGLPLGHRDARRRIGYLPELFRFQDWLTAEEVLRFHGRLANLGSAELGGRISEVLRDVDLSDRAHERVRGYSKGMQQRLGLACALLSKPDVLFLDEPASALDPGGRHDVRQLLSRLRDEGLTIFLNTHLLEDVESICSDVALLTNGSIRAQGSIDEILHPNLTWTFTVGGWDASIKQALDERVRYFDTTTHASLQASDSMTVLEVTLQNVEQAAYVNQQLVDLGLSVYTSSPQTNRLESWFLKLTDTVRGEGT